VLPRMSVIIWASRWALVFRFCLRQGQDEKLTREGRSLSVLGNVVNSG
jgi:hypothetical protein